MTRRISRRRFLQGLGLGAGAVLLGNMGLPAALAAEKNRRVASTLAQATDEAEVIVGDVLDYALTSEDWEGAFGWVRMQLHQALHNGEPAYYIRTDASSADFAEEHGLVHVPLLNAALSNEDAMSRLYTFENGVEEQFPVMSHIPGDERYSPAWHVHTVTFNGDAVLLASEEAIREAEAAGDVTVEALSLVVNHPVVKWAEGALQVDTDLTSYLGTGPLVSEPDTDEMSVTFKLHECYPGSRYIVTDTSTEMGAQNMNLAAALPTQLLKDAGAVDEIWVFSNGIPGSGVMGFQPAIFDNRAGDAGWSPFWDHFTAQWTDENAALLLTASDELRTLADAGLLEIFNGTPATHPNGFVVNCPVPIIAPNTFRPEA